DSALDIVIASSFTATVKLLKSDGTTGPLRATSYPMDSHSTAVAAADLNRDGYVDLVLTGSSSLDIALGESGGMFRDAVSYPVSGPIGRVVIADVSGDGIADLV